VLKPLVAQETLAGLAKVTDYGASTVSGSIGWDQDRTFRRTAVRLGLTHVAGSHTLKVGAEYEANWITWMLRLSYITVTADTVWPYQWWSAENFMEGYNRVPTLYLQDSWAVTPRVRVNAGLRWEGEWLGGVTGAGPHIADQFAPRLGVVLQPGPTGRHKITASYGRFFQQVAATSPGYWYGTGWNRTVNYTSNPLVHDVGGDTIGFQPQSSTQAEPHLRGESYDEFTAGYERLLSPVLKIGVRASARALNWSLDDTYQPGRIVFGNPGRGVLAYLPRAKRDYRALEVTLERSGRGPLTYLVSYVLSRLRGNTPGVWGQDVQANPSGGNCSPEFDNADGPQNWSGPLPNDRTHLFKFAGSYRWGGRATIGASAMVASGTPRTEQAASGAGWPYVTYVVGRGNLGRTPWTWDLNLRVSYLLPMQGRARSQLVLDVFHVGSPRQAIWYSDQHYLTPRDSSGVWSNPDPNYGRVQNYQPPMYARLGMQIDF